MFLNVCCLKAVRSSERLSRLFLAQKTHLVLLTLRERVNVVTPVSQMRLERLTQDLLASLVAKPNLCDPAHHSVQLVL